MLVSCCEQPQDLAQLASMLAEKDVDTLHADRAGGVDNDEAHLRDTAHAAHGLARFGQQVVLAGHSKPRIEQHWDADARDPLERL